VGRAPSPAKLANPTLLCSPDELALSDPSATRGVEWGGILQPRACPVLAEALSEVEGEVEGTCEESTVAPPVHDELIFLRKRFVSGHAFRRAV
jgi:hypothetical protein